MWLLENHPSRKLTAHVHGELSADESERVRTHLALCPDCRRRVGDIERVVALVRNPTRLAISVPISLPLAPVTRAKRTAAARLAVAVAGAAAAALILARVLVPG